MSFSVKSITTAKGIKVGDKLSDVLRLYGPLQLVFCGGKYLKQGAGDGNEKPYRYYMNDADGNKIEFIVDEKSGIILRIEAGFHLI